MMNNNELNYLTNFLCFEAKAHIWLNLKDIVVTLQENEITYKITDSKISKHEQLRHDNIILMTKQIPIITRILQEDRLSTKLYIIII